VKVEDLENFARGWWSKGGYSREKGQQHADGWLVGSLRDNTSTSRL
jgi:hypothetical protein